LLPEVEVEADDSGQAPDDHAGEPQRAQDAHRAARAEEREI
jgi:hypothetical protein